MDIGHFHCLRPSEFLLPGPYCRAPGAPRKAPNYPRLGHGRVLLGNSGQQDLLVLIGFAVLSTVHPIRRSSSLRRVRQCRLRSCIRSFSTFSRPESMDGIFCSAPRGSSIGSLSCAPSLGRSAVPWAWACVPQLNTPCTLVPSNNGIRESLATGMGRESVVLERTREEEVGRDPRRRS